MHSEEGFVMRTLLACLLAAGLCSLYAADPTGTIAGTVTDPSGAVIGGAKVKATAPATGLTRSTTTGPDGGYLLPLMPGGNYTITVDQSGFKHYEQRGVQVRADATGTVSVVLQLG